MIYERKDGGVLVAHPFPIDPIHVWRVKEVAHLPPAFEVDLVPLRVFIELHVEPGQLQLVIFGLKFVLGQIDNGVVLFNFDQHPLAIGRYLIGVDVAQDRLLTVLHAIETKVSLAIRTILLAFILAFLISNSAAEIEDTIVHQPNVAIVTRHDFYSRDAIMDAIQIDFNYHGLLRRYLGSRSRTGLWRGGRRFLLLGFLFFAFFFLLLGAFLFGLANFVTPRTKWGLRIFGQSDEVDALHIHVNVLKFVLGKGRFKITAGSEKQIFAIIAKGDISRAVPLIRHGCLLLSGNGKNVNASQIILFRARPGDPLAVGRPIVGLNFAPFILVYLRNGL